MTTDAAAEPGAGADEFPVFYRKPEDAPVGLCAGCPIRPGCALASDEYRTCPVTGAGAPSGPVGIPAQGSAPAAEAYADPDLDLDGAPEAVASRPDRSAAWADAAGRTAEAAVSAALGLSWVDLAIGLATGLNRHDSEGNEIDWARLQLRRNALAIGAATMIPLGDHTATMWVVEFLRDLRVGDLPTLPAMTLGLALPLLVGQVVPGPIGGICRATCHGAAVLGRWTWKFLNGRLGWLVTRPAIWAAICGFGFLTGRWFIRLLTGA
ncbi:hypothetical protein ACN20G_36835 (plasmid) [Streptomyces sp. BI20]|uniref:hypothetical protein n=1 Tax=Streptomyces sp. BI20 TaxID=3403460 RepID=UPI003C71F934